MTLPKDKKLKHEHIESMKIAVEQYDIRSIHPDKMEEFADILSKRQGHKNKCHKTPCKGSFFMT